MEYDDFLLYELKTIQSQIEALKSAIEQKIFSEDELRNIVPKIISDIGNCSKTIVVGDKIIWKEPMIHIYGPSLNIVNIKGGAGAFPGTVQWFAEQSKLNPEERENYCAFTEAVAGGLGKIMTSEHN